MGVYDVSLGNSQGSAMSAKQGRKLNPGQIVKNGKKSPAARQKNAQHGTLSKHANSVAKNLGGRTLQKGKGGM